jgi:hypothetical protein
MGSQLGFARKDPVTGRFLPGNKGKGNLKHGVNVFLQTGKLPSVRGKRLLNKYLRQLEKDLTAALGGSPTPQQGILIRQVLRAEGVLRLIEMWLQRVPAINSKGWKLGSLELQPCLSQSYGFFLNVQRQAVLSLGLGKKSEEVLTPYQIIEAEERAAAAEKAKAASQAKAVSKTSRARVKDGGQAQDEDPGAGSSRDGEGQGDGDE